MSAINLTPGSGRLAANIMHFCRTLRRAGLPVGPGRTLAAIEAVQAVGLGSRQDFYWALHSTLVNRRDQRAVFDQAFHIFWRNPDLLKRVLAMTLPQQTVERSAEDQRAGRRVTEALARNATAAEAPEEETEKPEVEIDARLTMSDKEALRSRDFADMSAEELADARKLIAAMTLPVRPVGTRRFAADPAGRRIDLRRTMRQSVRAGGAGIDLAWRRRRTRPPPIVVLCDISGSMSQYSRMLLLFLYAVTGDRERVNSFTFGTRLTNISRYLRHRDVDVALETIGQIVVDWSGGTRIGACLHAFNRHWSRRVLGQGAVVLLITDGLERDDAAQLAVEMERLHKSCRRLIWLNPLLRYDGYAPKTAGARTILPHIDDLRSVHNLDSLAELVDALNDHGLDRANMEQWYTRAASA